MMTKRETMNDLFTDAAITSIVTKNLAGQTVTTHLRAVKAIRKAFDRPFTGHFDVNELNRICDQNCKPDPVSRGFVCLHCDEPVRNGFCDRCYGRNEVTS